MKNDKLHDALFTIYRLTIGRLNKKTRVPGLILGTLASEGREQGCIYRGVAGIIETVFIPERLGEIRVWVSAAPRNTNSVDACLSLPVFNPKRIILLSGLSFDRWFNDFFILVSPPRNTKV